MFSIAELAHHRDPEAIAEFIRQELQNLDIESLVVEVTIVDSSLELLIRSDSAIDKEKLLALVRSEFQNLHIESVAKFRIHCWRNDEEMHEQRLLWTEQFMLEPSKSLPKSLISSSLSSSPLLDIELESEHERSPNTKSEVRSPEPQLSKHSVLQQAIAQISPDSPNARKHLLSEADNVAKQTSISAINSDTNNPAIAFSAVNVKKAKLAIDDIYLQLLLVGLSIMLLGLGIGAFVKAITLKSAVADKTSDKIAATSPVNNSPANPSEANISVKAPVVATKSAASQSNEPSPPTTKSPASKNNSDSSLEAIKPNSTDSELPTSTAPLVSQENDTVITLEKFNRIQKGMTIEQVEKILGSSGKVIAENNAIDSAAAGRVYSWKNLQGSNAIVEFKDGQVVAKAQAGL